MINLGPGRRAGVHNSMNNRATGSILVQTPVLKIVKYLQLGALKEQKWITVPIVFPHAYSHKLVFNLADGATAITVNTEGMLT